MCGFPISETFTLKHVDLFISCTKSQPLQFIFTVRNTIVPTYKYLRILKRTEKNATP